MSTLTSPEDSTREQNSRFALVPLNTSVARLDGLYVAGEVIGRRRTAYQQKGGEGQQYNIAVALIGQAGKLVLERWSDIPCPPDVPRVGKDAHLATLYVAAPAGEKKIATVQYVPTVRPSRNLWQYVAEALNGPLTIPGPTPSAKPAQGIMGKD